MDKRSAAEQLKQRKNFWIPRVNQKTYITETVLYLYTSLCIIQNSQLHDGWYKSLVAIWQQVPHSLIKSSVKWSAEGIWRRIFPRSANLLIISSHNIFSLRINGVANTNNLSEVYFVCSDLGCLSFELVQSGWNLHKLIYILAKGNKICKLSGLGRFFIRYVVLLLEFV